MKLKLYRKVRNELRLVDFGVISQAPKYKAMGYVIELADTNDNQKLYCVVKAEFKALWYTLPDDEKHRLADIPNDWEMTIEQKLALVKAEVSTRKKRSITVVPRRVKRPSLFSVVKDFFQSLIPMEVCYG